MARLVGNGFDERLLVCRQRSSITVITVAGGKRRWIRMQPPRRPYSNDSVSIDRRQKMTLAIGVIGVGVMGSEHVRILREETSGAELVAVCDADEGRARTVAGGARVYTDPLALLRSEHVDAVLVAAPDPLHGNLVLQCIEADKPVLCEKPLAGTAAEALKVVDAEIAKGRRLVQVGYMRRFDPPYMEMKRAVGDGEIGAPVVVHNVHRNPVAPDWFNGPMSITNAFVHEIDATRWLIDSEPVAARVYNAGNGDPLVVVMEMAGDVIVSSEVFMNCQYGYHVHVQVVGRTGTIETAPPGFVGRSVGGYGMTAYAGNWIDRFRPAYVKQLNEWVRSIGTGTSSGGAHAWDGYVTTSVAEQIVAGMGRGTSVTFATERYRPTMYA
ncbi:MULTISPECIES: Gfo/Idh/MocA family oxidoreductase [unclassified Burkholderia]|uniref:Gfo/Idh/MocA family protein n=1 Tax=unclassified Burkholderia TaxID=2613784 RepID=UPI002AB2B07F|nr:MULTISPECIES: Gfo/Idh/MocA family oxidoreductase [unclassified Burkholderia]